jgi:hypothetical protein
MLNRHTLLSAGAIAVSLLLSPGTSPTSSISAAPLNCLIVGGGPDKEDNQVGIESNVHYVRTLLPSGSTIHVLYTNGQPWSRIVQYEDEDGKTRYRPTTLTDVDGPSTRHEFSKYLNYLGHGDKPLLLYFTGHGSPDRDYQFVNNAYDLWGTDTLTVSDLNKELKNVDPGQPLTLVMVQCFSGGFAPVFFQGSTAQHPHVRPDSCGFFAAVPQRESAGCTSEVDEANYHDFTTYFFGALSGHDRVGRAVTGVDYDGDGVVEMDEAYAYALINDESIDTPMATSDAYVRQFTNTPEKKIFAVSYSTVLSEATPAQRAALEALSKRLNMTGEDRLKRAYDGFIKRVSVPETSESEEQEDETARWIRYVRLAKTIVLEHQIETSAPADVRAGLDELLKAEHKTILDK